MALPYERLTGEPDADKAASPVRRGAAGKGLREQHLADRLPYYDHTKWGVELCKKLGSPRFKLLYDIYHMQIMEGDIIRTVRDNKEYLGHFHTGGNPGRHEIDETQELNYPAIVRAIVETGYQGYLGQEFIPRRDPLQSLAQGFHICDV